MTPDTSKPLDPHTAGEGSLVLARVLDSITDGVVVVDEQWKITYFNEAARKLYSGHFTEGAEAVLGRNHWDVFPELVGTPLQHAYYQAAATGQPAELENYYAPWKAWFQIRAFPIRGGGMSIYFREVTAAKQAELRLRQSEEKYRLLFNSLDEGFSVVRMLWNEDGSPRDYEFVEVNPMFEKLTGIRDAKGRTAAGSIPGLEARWFEIYGRVAKTRKSIRFEEGSQALGRWYDVYAFPLGDEPDLVAILFTDITDRRENQVELARVTAAKRARVAELETLLEVLPVGIGIALDRDCRDIRVNPSFARLLKLTPGENASKTAEEGHRPEHFRVLDDLGNEVPADKLPMQMAAREGRPVTGIEFNIAFDNGEKVRLLEYAAPLFGENGVPRGSVGAFVDITERRVAAERQKFMLTLEETLRPLTSPAFIVQECARRLGEHLEVSRCAYASIAEDQDTMHILGNHCVEVPSIVGQYAFAQFGAPVLELMRAGKPYVVEDTEQDGLPEEVLAVYRRAQIRSVICAPLHKGGRFVAAMAVHHKAARRWTESEAELVMHVANRCWEALERTRVSQELAESESRLRTLADNIAQLAWMGDADGHLFWYNQRWFDYTGTNLEQMLGWGWSKVHHPDHLERVTEKWKRHLAAGEAWEDTFPLRGVDGGYRWFLSRAVPIHDGQGKVSRWFGTNTDVTDQRRAAEELARAKEAAEAANRAKDNFLAALSHELRTPLTPVLMAAEDLCDDPALPQELRGTLCMMRRNITLEARLIDDLLDLTRIARGKFSLRLQEADAHALAQMALDIVQEDAQAKQQTIALDLKATQTAMNCDPARVQQVFWNLFKNAVRFTPAGGSIQVRTWNESGRLLVEVCDTGVGIPSDALERIFLPFEQASESQEHRFGGLGLGLSISKAIVEMHGGSITATSRGLNQGAIFRVDLPLSVVEQVPVAPQPVKPAFPSTPPPGQDDHPKLDLLVVEDHAHTLDVLSRLLRRAGHRVTTASSVAAARAIASAQRFDMLVSDIGLPDGTGNELMAGLRSEFPALRGIALTGYGMEEDERRALEAGFAAHLTKPVDFAQLKRTLEQVAQRAD